MTKKNIDYDNIIKLINKNIVVNLKYFYKQKDYTKLIEIIILCVNETLKINDNQFNIVINCEDYKVLETDIDFIKHLIQFLQNTYQDKLAYMYFTNYSSFIKTIFNNLKRHIDKDTVPKIIFN